MDAGPVCKPDPDRRLELVVDARERAAHPVCRADRPKSVILVDRRQSEDRHDRIADVLLDEPTMALDLCPHRVEVWAYDFAECLGVEGLPERRRALQVREDDSPRL